MHETLSIDSARIMRPKGSTFITPNRTDIFGAASQPEKKTDFLKLTDRVSPIGSRTDIYSPVPGQMRSTDYADIELFLVPPSDWDGGSVTIDLRISSKALTLRSNRTVIKRRITARPVKQIEEKAISRIPT